jgi:LAGLIDADG DNA endonuclease family
VAHIGEALTRQALVGNTEGRLLVVETLFARNARAVPLTDLQRDFVIGSLLGDAYLMPTTAGCCLRVSHGEQQRLYVDWKFEIISDLVRTAPRACGRSYYFRTVTHPDFSGLREAFYAPGASKGIPIDLIERELTAFGLAIWFMDDGATDRNQLRINTQGFSRDENLVLAEFLHAKFGITVQLNKDKDRHRLRIAAKSVDRFVDLVAPHIIPSMRYKLPL